MSNRVDFFQSENTKLSLPAANLSFFLEDTLCDWLSVAEICRCDWPEFSWARLVFNGSAYSQANIDFTGGELIGRCIRIEQVYNNVAKAKRVCCLPVFIGQIESFEKTKDAKGEQLELIARDFSAVLNRTTVFGQRVADSDGSTMFLAGRDTTFNAEDSTNATAKAVQHNGKNYIIFCAEPSNGKAWSYADVIHYLLCEYLPVGQLRIPDFEQLQTLTENQTVRDLNVTGLSLLEALHLCCQRTMLSFKFTTYLTTAGPQQTIVFYKKGDGRAVELNCQPDGQWLSVSKTNIETLHSKRNFWPITNRFIGQGDFKVYEATFDLVKAWDSNDEDTDYDKLSPSTNTQFYKVKDVYRKWCLNEAGDYSSQPFNRGDTFDFSKIFDTSNFAGARRRFLPTLTTDKQGKSLGYYLQVSFDNGYNWWQYLYAFNILLNECGVWLSSDQLDARTWVAAMKGVLKFRITASIVSDERLSCVVADGPVNSTVPVVDNVIALPRQFKYRKVSGCSIFAGSSDDFLGTPDETDDSKALYEFIRKKAQFHSQILENIDVRTPYLAFGYDVGDVVTSSPESKDLFNLCSDNQSTLLIEKVRMDFQNQCTDLKIARRRSVL
ncbi:MAG: hypothetical protein ACYSSI_01945 [Planctomycetota bacterium]